jgi:4-amino-4-deoxy-L-arabinose transferase-like glycosyltransferase
MREIVRLIRRHPTQAFVLFLTIVGAFLRFYNIRNTMQFFGDQGRDAIIARKILINHHPALIGPVTSVGNMYLGPFYYYFMVFPLMMTYPDPIGPTIAVAFLGTLTIFLLYELGKDLVGKRAAVIAAILYTFSPVVITNVRFSWNPNIVPLVALCMLWSMYKAYSSRSTWWIWVSIFFSILFQLHYITLIMALFAVLLWMRELFVHRNEKSYLISFATSTMIAIGIFLISLIPLVIFDIRHDYMNFKGFSSFFTGKGDKAHFGFSASGIFFSWISLIIRNLFETFAIKIKPPFSFILFGGLLLSLLSIFKQRTVPRVLRKSQFFLTIFFFFGTLILAFYRSSIYDHYLGFLYPVSCLVWGILLSYFWNTKLLRPLIGIVLVVLIGFSLSDYPGRHSLGYNVDLSRTTSQAIASHVEPGEAFDIIVFSITKDFYGMNYRYFLETMNKRPVDDEQVHQFKKLFIIDETQKENVLSSPEYKIAMWPNRTVVDDFWIPNGPHVLVLVR